MKKNIVSLIIITSLSLTLLLSSCINYAGNNNMDEEEASTATTQSQLPDEVSPSADEPASVEPSEQSPDEAGDEPSVQPSTEPSVQPSAEPSYEPPAEATSEVSHTPDDDEQTPGAGDKTDYFALGEVLVETETFGNVSLFMPGSELVDIIGQPDSQSDPEVWEADGSEHCIWTYMSNGLYLDMTRYSEDEGFVVYSITAVAPCDLETGRGIAIGDAREEVLAVYADEYNESESSEDLIVLGSLYSGMLVTVEEGIVTGFYVGAMAE